MPLNRHSRRSVDITLLSQFREHRDVPNLACGGRGGPRSAAACPGTTAGSTWNGFSSRAAARGRAGGRVPPLGARRCRRDPPAGAERRLIGRSAGTRGRSRGGGRRRQPAGWAAEPASSRWVRAASGGGRGQQGPGPAASCRQRTGLPGIPADSSLFTLHLH